MHKFSLKKSMLINFYPTENIFSRDEFQALIQYLKPANLPTGFHHMCCEQYRTLNVQTEGINPEQFVLSQPSVPSCHCLL